jgi:hypothetical protein
MLMQKAGFIYIYKLFFVIIIGISVKNNLSGFASGECNQQYFNESLKISVNDTLIENQILYNGKVWRNLYFKIKEDQFFLSNDYITGSITITGKTYKNLEIRYDIYNDEIITPTNLGSVVQVNKEMVDSFSLKLSNTTYRFINYRADSLKGISGYVNLLYKGKCQLYVKYRKEIKLLAVDRKYDKFSQLQRVYLVKDGIAYQVNSRQNLLNLFGDDKHRVKEFIKINRLGISKNMPESYVPVIRFYDNLR